MAISNINDYYNLSIDEKFEEAVRKITLEYPSFLQFYLLFQKVKVTNPDVTIRINTIDDSVAHLEYNEDFINKIHPITLTVLICVEVLRLILHHCTERKLNPINVCWQASNVACSPFTVTKMLNELNMIQNKVGHDNVNLTDLYPSISTFNNLIPKNFDPNKDLFMENIFKIFMKNQDEFEKTMESLYPQQGTDGDDPNNGSGSGNPSQDEANALKKHFGQSAHTATAGWGENEIIDNQVQQKVNECSTSTWSDLPGGLANEIIVRNRPVVDPTRPLREFSQSVIANTITHSRMKFPRRYGESFIGIMPGGLHEMKSRVLIAIDSSGSMPDSEIEKASMAVNNFLKHADVDYCYWDGACGDIVSLKNTASRFNVTGRGCTNPQCVIDKIKREKRVYDGIVYITDCQFDWPKPNILSTIFIIQSRNADPVPAWVQNRHMTMNEIDEVDKIIHR